MAWLSAAVVKTGGTGTAAGLWAEKSATAVFDVLSQRQDGVNALANQFLQTGIDHYQHEDYKRAATAFAAAVGLAPFGGYNVEASRHLAQSYLRLGETGRVIDTYSWAIQRNPERDDLRSALGQFYYSQKRYGEAVAQYRGAVRVNPNDANRYALGEALLKIDSYGEAEHQFREVKRLAPHSHVGDYGLGKLYARSGDPDRAIAYFENALARQPDFYDALAEIGYTLADAGDIAAARAVNDQLAESSPDLAGPLRAYIAEKAPPEIQFALATGSFPFAAGKGTAVAAIDAYLENAGAAKSVTMQFIFSKPMDAASVENRFNWSLSRADGPSLAHTYNFGDRIAETEVALDPFPDYVLYDPGTFMATVGFTVRQNERADGTIDPSHIVFTFAGEDLHGLRMDPVADEFSGFSRLA